MRRDGSRAPAPPELAPAIYALWHGHLLPLACLHRDQAATLLVSRHRDGQLLAGFLSRLGYDAVTGSSGAGGATGLREMVRRGRAGGVLAFTPDGPRGPVHRSKSGVILAAAETGMPIIPAAAAARHAWRARSWDGFLVPMPGATVYVAYGPPLRVPREAVDAPAPWLAALDDALGEVSERCEAQ